MKSVVKFCFEKLIKTSAVYIVVEKRVVTYFVMHTCEIIVD